VKAMRRKEYACPNGCSLPPRRKQLREYNDGTYGFDFYDFTPDDVKLEGYETHPQIKNIPIAV